MAESNTLEDLIIEKAGELFCEQGYSATSIKQIAKASGCTTAALYYYFEEGKQHILREVIRRSSRKAENTMIFPEADSLEEFLVALSAVLVERFPMVAERFNWLILQFATLPDEEKRILQDQVIGIHQALREQMERYVADEGTVDRLAWMVFSSFFGYHQFFTKMEVGQRVDLSAVDYGQFLAQVVAQDWAQDWAQSSEQDL